MAVFACRQGNQLALTLVNTDAGSHAVSLASRDFRVPTQTALRTTLAGTEKLGLATRAAVQATAEVEVGHLSDGGSVFAAWTIAGYSLQRIDVHIG